MTEGKITMAIFDFDGTLTEGHLWSGISKHHKQNKIKRLAIYTYLYSHLPFWLAAKLKLYSDEKNKLKWGEDLSILIKGFTIEEANKAFGWIADNYFMPLMRIDVMERLKEHKKLGHKAVLLSGMFQNFLEVMGNKIGIDYAIGTKLEVRNNIFSGRIIQPLCFGENKAKLLKEFVEQYKLQVDYSQSFAYADSIYDVPVLRLVGNPMPAYPDKDLRQLARNQNWKMIGQP
jgi:HAD superfamily hydrolase (TIGR01490 family)